jgi:hypothetical protein
MQTIRVLSFDSLSPTRHCMLLVVGVVIISKNLSSTLSLVCIYAQTMCEPLRSLEEGLCPFTPSEEAQRHAAAITDLDEELAQVRLRLDRYGLAPVFVWFVHLVSWSFKRWAICFWFSNPSVYRYRIRLPVPSIWYITDLRCM